MAKTFNMAGGGGGGIKLASIEITTAPDKLTYLAGETFDPAGMAVTATYTNGAAALATGWTYSPTGALAEGDTVITVIYTEGGVTKTDTVTVTASVLSVAIPTVSGNLTYNGNSQSPTWNGYDAEYMTIGGTTSAVSAGTYQAVFTLKDTTGTKWADGTTAAKNVSWTIERAAVAVPSQSGSLTYTGGSQSPSWSGYDPSKMTIGGVTSGVDAGTYTATFTPGSNYKWTDGSTGAKDVNWSIAKAAGSLTVSPNTITLNTENLTGTITVTRPGDGAITAQSNNTGVAAVSVSGNIVTVSNVNQASGEATITISVAEGTNYTAPASKTVAVSAEFIPDFNGSSWAQISQISASGDGPNYWSIGDIKVIGFDGVVGTTEIHMGTYTYIVDFDHNEAYEGPGISIMLFRLDYAGLRDVAIVDGYYGTSKTDGTKAFNINHNGNITAGGWKGCDLRMDVLGSTDNANGEPSAGYALNPTPGTVMACLPADLRAVMKYRPVFTDNMGYSGQSDAAAVTATYDYLPLMSEYELFGEHTYANASERTYQQQYAYYTAGNSVEKYKQNSLTSTAAEWTRSPLANSGSSFCYVSTSQTASYTDTSRSYGISPVLLV